jgi:2-hydroxycyclohexanecarboxyl-CoA dehydrogenase
VFDLNLEAAEAVAGEITAAGGGRAGLRCDITDRASVDTAVPRPLAQLGPIDVLVNNAGWDVFKPFTKTARRVGQADRHQPDRRTAHAPRGAAGHGRAQVRAHRQHRVRRGAAWARPAKRCTRPARAAWSRFSKTIAREHARHGITVNVVCPGPTDTALFADYKEGAGNPEKLVEAFTRAIPLGRIGQPDDLPGAILFFASDDAAFITGQVLSVSGGLTMAG